jgi:hypothetical protein
MARDLVFQDVDVLGQNELKLTSVYTSNITPRAKLPDNHIGEGDGREDEEKGREGR